MANNSQGVSGHPGSSGSSNETERRNRRNQLLIVLVPALISALAALGVALLYAKPWSHPDSCPVNLTITSPSAGQAVDGAEGIEVVGKSCGMSGSTGWLFDYDLSDEHYYMDYPVSSPNNAAPIIVSNGGWSYNDSPIGSPGDVNQTYGITVVLASPPCTKELESAKPDASGDIIFKTFPSGCKIEDAVDVEVTYH
jgi:hypothetical protein